MKEFFDNYLANILVIVVICFLTWGINKLIDGIINKAIILRRKKHVTTLLIFIKKVKKLMLYVIAFLVCLGQFKVFNSFTMTLLSGLGIGSVVLGLAAQESLKNFFGSFAIVVGNVYEVGDFIECVTQGVSGTVEDVTMRHTVIRTINNRRVIIPNSQMNTYTIENFNYSENENVKLVDFPVSYDADVDKAMEIIKKELGKMYHPNPKGRNKDVEFPKVRVASWEDSCIKIRAWIWGKDNSDVYNNMYNLNYIIKKEFDKNGIEIPYPHIVTVNKSSKKFQNKPKKNNKK